MTYVLTLIVHFQGNAFIIYAHGTLGLNNLKLQHSQSKKVGL